MHVNIFASAIVIKCRLLPVQKVYLRYSIEWNQNIQIGFKLRHLTCGLKLRYYSRKGYFRVFGTKLSIGYAYAEPNGHRYM